MTLAACSRSRRCCSCASMIACSSCTFGSARSLNEPDSFAVMYFHQRLTTLNMDAKATPPAAQIDRPRRNRLRSASTSSTRRARRQAPYTTTPDQHAHHEPDDGAPARRRTDGTGGEVCRHAHDGRGDCDPHRGRRQPLALEPPDAAAQGHECDAGGDDVGGGVGEREALHAERSDEREREHDVDAVLDHVQEERRPRVLHARRSLAGGTGRARSRAGRPRSWRARRRRAGSCPRASAAISGRATTIIPTADGSTTSVINRMPYDSRSRKRTMSPAAGSRRQLRRDRRHQRHREQSVRQLEELERVQIEGRHTLALARRRARARRAARSG